MRKVGNQACNKQYNPRNVRPTIPIDSDEVDSAMEKFIRDKYQHRTFSNAQTTTNTTTTTPSTRQNTGSVSSDDRGPPPPPKPLSKFGPALRAASSTFPLSQNEMTRGPSPRPPPKNDAYIPREVVPPAQAQGTIETLEVKKQRLRDMGYTNDARNDVILRVMNGDVAKAAEALRKVAAGQDNTSSYSIHSSGSQTSNAPRSQASMGQHQFQSSHSSIGLAQNHLPSPATSNNPFDSVPALNVAVQQQVQQARAARCRLSEHANLPITACASTVCSSRFHDFSATPAKQPKSVLRLIHPTNISRSATAQLSSSAANATIPASNATASTRSLIEPFHADSTTFHVAGKHIKSDSTSLGDSADTTAKSFQRVTSLSISAANAATAPSPLSGPVRLESVSSRWLQYAAVSATVSVILATTICRRLSVVRTAAVIFPVAIYQPQSVYAAEWWTSTAECCICIRPGITNATDAAKSSVSLIHQRTTSSNGQIQHSGAVQRATISTTANCRRGAGAATTPAEAAKCNNATSEDGCTEFCLVESFRAPRILACPHNTQVVRVSTLPKSWLPAPTARHSPDAFANLSARTR
ncbi:hypothetical protein MRB53_037090 [Persea americana]|nr:hypothetical protein MRB53_037090 [Persea americana]